MFFFDFNFYIIKIRTFLAFSLKNEKPILKHVLHSIILILMMYVFPKIIIETKCLSISATF